MSAKVTWPPRLPEWAELKRALGVKTVYLSGLLLVVGLALLLLGASPTFSSNPPQALPGWAVVAAGIGTTLITSAVFSFVSETMVRLDTIDFFEAQFEDLRPSENGAAGAYRLLSSRRDFDFTSFIKHASEDVRIVGFSANDVLSPVHVDQWRRVIQAGRVRSLKILLIDPASADAAQRAKAPCYPRPGSFVEKCKASLSEIADLSNGLSGDLTKVVECRMASSNITVSMIADGRHLLLTPILWNRTGGSSPSIVLNNADDTADEWDSYIQNFDALWGSANALP